MAPGAATPHVGVLGLVVSIPGSRGLKERRGAVRPVLDRLRARFDVSAHELPSDAWGRSALVVTTAGGDARVVQAALDKVLAFVQAQGDVLVVGRRLEVFPWQLGEDPGAWARDAAALVEGSDDETR